MPEIHYSVSAFGTGDIQTGSGNISITSGVATVPAQTGNIGCGCAMEFLSTVVYISAVNSSTSFDVVTAIGGTPNDQGSTSLTSIHHVWAGLQDAENAYLGASFLNTTDLVTNDYNPFFWCYYDHDDQTAASSISINGATADGTNFLTLKAPTGGTESINNQMSETGVFDTNRFHSSVSSNTIYEFSDEGVKFIGLQVFNETNSDATARCFFTDDAISDWEIRDCIVHAPDTGNGITINNVGASGKIVNCTVYSDTSQGGNSEGIYLQNCSTVLVCYTLVTNFNDGIERDSGTVTVTNCASFNNGTDFDGTMTISNCASDDGTGSNPVTIGTLASIYTGPTDTPRDWTLLDFTGTGAVLAQGTGISGETVDMLGNARDGSTPDIGPFEFLSAGGDNLTSSDTFELSDTMSMTAIGDMSLSDTFEFSDTFTATVAGLMGLSDNYEFSDTAQNIGAFIMSLADTGTFSDQVSFQSGNYMNLSDGIALSDVLSADAGVLNLTLNDGVTFSDALSSISAAAMALDDTYIITDLASLNTGELVEGPITIRVRVKQSTFDILIKQPGFNIEVN